MRPPVPSRVAAPAGQGEWTVADLVAEVWPETGAPAGYLPPPDTAPGPTPPRRRRRQLPAPLAAATVLTVGLTLGTVGWLVSRPDAAVDTPTATPNAASTADARPRAAAPPAARVPSAPPAAEPDKAAPSARAPGGNVRVRAGPIDCARPGRILDLGNWKLTLPTASRGGSGPTEILGQRLGSFGTGDWFHVGQACNAVAFRAPVNGVTTSGSRNPRSELREMGSGGAKAGWSSTAGTHTMTLTEAFTRLPTGKPQVVGGQIHDKDDDVSVFRLEGTDLYVTNGDNTHYQLVTSNYALGTPFEAKYVVRDGVVRAYYNGDLVATINRAFSDAYFKAGAYTQANCQDAAPCDSDNYGEVLIYALKVTHQ